MANLWSNCSKGKWLCTLVVTGLCTVLTGGMEAVVAEGEVAISKSITSTTRNIAGDLSYTSLALEDDDSYHQSHIFEVATGKIFLLWINSTEDHLIANATEQDLQILYQQAAELAQEGSYSEAISLLEDILIRTQQQVGAEHPATATVLSDLAKLYSAIGRYDDAEILFGRSLNIFKQQLGFNDAKLMRT